MAESQAHTPLCLWAETKDFVFLTVQVTSPEQLEIDLQEQSLDFKCESEGTPFHFHLDFPESIKVEESKYSVQRNVQFKLVKAEHKRWRRVTRDGRKLFWLKCDWDKWIDSDEEDSRAMDMNDFDMNAMDFGGAGMGTGGLDFGSSGMGMGGMGGLGGMGGMGGMGGDMDFGGMDEADSDDDADLSDVEEAMDAQQQHHHGEDEGSEGLEQQHRDETEAAEGESGVSESHAEKGGKGSQQQVNDSGCCAGAADCQNINGVSGKGKSDAEERPAGEQVA